MVDHRPLCACLGTTGVDPGFSEGGGGGGANGTAWHMAVAAGRVPLKLLPCVLYVCSYKFIFCGI